MFGWFKRDPVKALEKRYKEALEHAMQLQRHGDIPGFAVAHARALELEKQLEQLERSQQST